MTAAGGIRHEEYRSDAFTRAGGVLEMVQLRANWPAADKLAEPGCQALLDADIPTVALADGAGQGRVVAGGYLGSRGPARTFSPVDLWDRRLDAGHCLQFGAAQGHTLACVVLRGAVLVNDSGIVREAQRVLSGRESGEVRLEANSDGLLLVLGAEPISEPVAAYGPFVTNTPQQIVQALADFNAGTFGRAAA